MRYIQFGRAFQIYLTINQTLSYLKSFVQDLQANLANLKSIEFLVQIAINLPIFQNFLSKLPKK